MDLQFLIFLFPAGVFMCFRQLRDEHVFVIIYAVVASYFAGVMVRLMLTLTPVVCVSSAVAVSALLDTYLDAKHPGAADESMSDAAKHVAAVAKTPATPQPTATPSKKAKKAAAAHSPSTPGDLLTSVLTTPTKESARKPAQQTSRGIYGFDTRFMIVLNTLCMLCFFVAHCTWVTSNAYSSPSVVLASQNSDGSQHIIDDFREAYYWLRQNTPETAVVMSWWDYGYQIAGMADRPTLVDNNTWNNSQPSSFPFFSLALICLLVSPSP